MIPGSKINRKPQSFYLAVYGIPALFVTILHNIACQNTEYHTRVRPDRVKFIFKKWIKPDIIAARCAVCMPCNEKRICSIWYWFGFFPT